MFFLLLFLVHEDLLPAICARLFNISYSNNIGILSISEKSQIGIDVELIDEKCDFKKLMDIFMFANDKQWVLEEESVYRFFTLWTMKEAVLKQSGDGISTKGFPKITIKNNKFQYNNRKIKNLFIEEKSTYYRSMYDEIFVQCLN